MLETTKSEKERKLKHKNTIFNNWETTTKGITIFVTGIPEGEERQKEKEVILKAIMNKK